MQGDYVLDVQPLQYQNSMSRCAECGDNQGCCDRFAEDVCSGVLVCDNYFTFCIRPFESESNLNLSIETDCPLGQLTTSIDNIIQDADQLIFNNFVRRFAIPGRWTVSARVYWL